MSRCIGDNLLQELQGVGDEDLKKVMVEEADFVKRRAAVAKEIDELQKASEIFREMLTGGATLTVLRRVVVERTY